MIHVTAAIGLGLAFLLEIIFWSIAPIIAAVLVGLLVLGAIVWAVMRTRRRSRDAER